LEANSDKGIELYDVYTDKNEASRIWQKAVNTQSSAYQSVLSEPLQGENDASGVSDGSEDESDTWTHRGDLDDHRPGAQSVVLDESSSARAPSVQQNEPKTLVVAVAAAATTGAGSSM
jgi:hypothetical protein